LFRQPERCIQFPVGQQSRIGGDLTAAELQLQAAVKTDPQILVLAVTHRVPLSAWHELAECPCFIGVCANYVPKRGTSSGKCGLKAYWNVRIITCARPVRTTGAKQTILDHYPKSTVCNSAHKKSQKQQQIKCFWALFEGSGGGIRTPDTRIMIPQHDDRNMMLLSSGCD
ncbi:MAG: hypothetical protein K0U90_20380, partial [Planctomycetes bacterium]|nr:hypothetical protein [Planctomycetota bacterium]